MLLLTGLNSGPVGSSPAIGAPISYADDELYNLALVKNVLETGRWSENPRLGAPGGQVHLDFPTPGLAWVSLLLIRGLGLFTANPFLAANLFTIATFALVAAAGYVFLSSLRLGPILAGSGALLYSLLPYHWQRANFHLLLLGYYSVPLALALAVWLMRPGRRRRPTPSQLLAIAALAPLLAGTGVYYAFFSGYFLVLAGAAGFLRSRDPHRLLGGFAAAALIAAVTAAALVPTWRYARQEGANSVLLEGRTHAGTETFALKLSQLILPVDGHRVPWLRELKKEYRHAPLVNENSSATLGALGAVGALVMLGWLLGGRFASTPRERQLRHRLDELSSLFLAGLLLGTVGGFGSLFGLLISAKIRAYNRISVYLALLAFGTVLLLVDRAGRRLTGRARGLAVAGWTVVVAVAVLDLVPAHARARPATVAPRFDGDARFVARIEAAAGGPRTVFQLPFRVYPEGGENSYEALRPYLHSGSFRWSAGAIKGRPQAQEDARLAGLPLSALLPALRRSGFDALLIDRNAYPDGAAALAGSARAELGIQSVESADWIFFDLLATPTVGAPGAVPAVPANAT
jgi:phosphoglycerol transferase